MAEGHEIRIGRLHLGIYKRFTNFFIGHIPPDEGFMIHIWKFYLWYQN